MTIGGVGDGGIFPRPRRRTRPPPLAQLRYGDGFHPRQGSVLRRGLAEFTSEIRNFNYTPPTFMKLCGNLKNIMDNMQYNFRIFFQLDNSQTLNECLNFTPKQCSQLQEL